MYKDLFSVKDKKVVLTGAAGGIGSALLRGFLENGAKVIATSRTDTDWGNCKDFGDNFIPYKVDLANKEQLAGMLNFIDSTFGICDVLVNNASISLACPKEDLHNLDALKQTMAIGLEAPYYLCGQIAPKMAEKKSGSIINITSLNAEVALPLNPSYIATKGGLRMLTKSIARDFGEFGVRANNLCPGYVHTRMTNISYNNPTLHEERLSRTMLKRWGITKDMVGPCLFLASEASSYITGADLHVDGGWLAKGL